MKDILLIVRMIACNRYILEIIFYEAEEEYKMLKLCNLFPSNNFCSTKQTEKKNMYFAHKMIKYNLLFKQYGG